MSKKVALDAGHGLKTNGKQTPDGIKEWTLNDKVRDKIVAMLKGYDVEFVFPDKNEGATDESLGSRVGMYIKEKVDAAVSIHHNANTGKWNAATGVEVFVDKKATDADLKLANLIYPKLVKYTGLNGRGVKRENFTVIYQNTVPAVLVEGGFMDGKTDHPVITSDEGQTAYAKAVAEGLIEFLDLKKVSSVTASTIKHDYSLKDFIKDVQRTTGAKVDGIAGPETLSKTITLSAILNRKDPLVYYVQRRLLALGYTEVGKVDGIAGGKFTAAVKHFQRDNGCTSDGEITARYTTWKKLLGLA